MKNFEISETRNEKPNDNEQKVHRKKARFSLITHADQPSPSVVHEKEWARPKEEQSAYSDVSIEDVIYTKEQKGLEKVRKALDKAKQLSLKMEMNNWDKLTIEKIVEDKSYAEHAHQCFLEFNNQLQEWMHLVKDEEATGQHDEKTIKQLLTALKDLTDHYDKVITVKRVIKLVQARKRFKEKGDREAARSVRKALEKFDPPQHLIAYHREKSTVYWFNKSINEVNDGLMCKILDEVIDCKKINQKLKLGNSLKSY